MRISEWSSYGALTISMALKQNVEDDQVVAMTSAYTSKALDKDSHYMFRLYSAPEDYLPSMIGWMKDNLTARRVVVVNPNDETGWDQVRLSEAIFKKNGFEVLGQDRKSTRLNSSH